MHPQVSLYKSCGNYHPATITLSAQVNAFLGTLLEGYPFALYQWPDTNATEDNLISGLFSLLHCRGDHKVAICTLFPHPYNTLRNFIPCVATAAAKLQGYCHLNPRLFPCLSYVRKLTFYYARPERRWKARHSQEPREPARPLASRRQRPRRLSPPGRALYPRRPGAGAEPPALPRLLPRRARGSRAGASSPAARQTPTAGRGPPPLSTCPAPLISGR